MVQFGHLKIRFCRFRTKGRNANISGSKWPIDFFGMLVEAFSLSSVPQYLRFYSRVDILSARWKALSVCLLVTKCTYNCQNHRVIILITRWIRAIILPTFCRLDCVLQRIWPSRPHFEALNGNIGIKTSKWGFDSPRASKSSKWGLAVAVSFIPSFWGHEFRDQSDIVSLWFTVGFCRLNLLSTIYPKSRFCTKRHKRLYFQCFLGIFESFSQNAEKGNCKFEPQKCKSVFVPWLGTFHTHKPLSRRKPFLWL